jgi:hypothetical protein
MLFAALFLDRQGIYKLSKYREKRFNASSATKQVKRLLWLTSKTWNNRHLLTDEVIPKSGSQPRRMP